MGFLLSRNAWSSRTVFASQTTTLSHSKQKHEIRLSGWNCNHKRIFQTLSLTFSRSLFEKLSAVFISHTVAFVSISTKTKVTNWIFMTSQPWKWWLYFHYRCHIGGMSTAENETWPQTVTCCAARDLAVSRKVSANVDSSYSSALLSLFIILSLNPPESRGTPEYFSLYLKRCDPSTAA